MSKYHLDSIKTFKYITEPNAYIYRPIVRFLYNKHMNLEHYKTTINEIYEMLVENQVVDEQYSITHLQESLDRLEEWEVIKADQEKPKGMTIPEFKYRKYLYQILDLGIEIESLLVRIDELDESIVAKMDGKQFSILLKHIELFKDMDPKYISSHEKVYEIWSNVFDTHKKLRTNASNYLFHIQQAERSNLFNTALFLEFKDTFMQYLGTFITELERVKFKIYKVLQDIDECHIDSYIEVLVEASRPNQFLQENFSEERLRISLKNKWFELKTWFLGMNGSTSDIDVLKDKTKEAIRLIVTYANRLSDSKNTKDRISEYQALARMFKDSGSLEQAHILYGAAFGATHSRSLHATEKIEIIDDGRYTNGDEIWNTSIMPFKTPNMGNRGPKGKSKASVIKNNRIEQQRRIMENLKKKKEEEQKVKELIKDGKIMLSEIENPLEPFQRKVLLKWLMRTAKMRMGKSKKTTFRTETGLTLRVQYRSKDIIVIPSTDGDLRGYDIEFIVEGDNA